MIYFRNLDPRMRRIFFYFIAINTLLFFWFISTIFPRYIEKGHSTGILLDLEFWLKGVQSDYPIFFALLVFTWLTYFLIDIYFRIFRYLEPVRVNLNGLSDVGGSLATQIKAINERISTLSVPDDERIINVVENIKNEIREGLNKEIIRKMESDAYLTHIVDYLDSKYQRMSERIQDEIRSLGKKGNINLSVGVIFGVLGFILFGIMLLFMTDIGDGDVSKIILGSFVPRLSLVLLIEIFSYFFLNLYKSTLHEIKYYQNELTNLECKFIPLFIAIKNKNEKLSADIMSNIVACERNYILKSNETTVEIENEKRNNNVMADLAAKTVDVIGKKSK